MRGLTEQQSMKFALFGIVGIILCTYVLIYQNPTTENSNNTLTLEQPHFQFNPLDKLHRDNTQLAHQVIEPHLSPTSELIHSQQSQEILVLVEQAIDQAALTNTGHPLDGNTKDELLNIISNFTEITAEAYSRKEQGLMPYTPKTQLQFITLITSGDEKFNEAIGVPMSTVMASLGEDKLFQLVTQSN